MQPNRDTRRRRWAVYTCTLLLGVASVGGQQPPTPDPDRFEAAIQKFEAADKLNPPVKGGIVFYGAGAIGRWNLEESFPDLKGVAVNRGFGGSELVEQTRYASRVIIPRAPRVVVLYPGENEIARGLPAETVGVGFRQFYEAIHAALPNTRIVLIGLRPVPYRWQFIDEIRKANTIIRPFCETHPNCVYVDVHPDLIGRDGKPKTDLLADGREHMNAEGYKIWSRLVRPYLQ
jgi:lysophospholipase L1-like esterase